MQIQDSYPIIITDRLFDCRDFYTRFFDLQIGFESSWFIWLTAGEDGPTSLAFMHPEHPSAPPGPEPFNGKGMCLEFQVEDVTSEYNRFLQAGAKITLSLTDEPFGQRRFGLVDPAGLWIDVVQQIEPAAGFWDKYMINDHPAQGAVDKTQTIFKELKAIVMKENKTKATDVSVEDYLAVIQGEIRREDCQALVNLMSKVTAQQPRMWGPSIVGFDSYHYKYASGHEGDSCVVGFSPSKRDISVYLIAGYESSEAKELLSQLGKHKIGQACLYIRCLSDVDVKVLEKLVFRSVAEVKRIYGQHNAQVQIVIRF